MNQFSPAWVAAEGNWKTLW